MDNDVFELNFLICRLEHWDIYINDMYMMLILGQQQRLVIKKI